MNVSALEEYGLRCAVRLAQAYHQAEPSPSDGQPIKTSYSAPEIAELEGLSVEYVSKFMLHLKRAGLVQAARGVNGGFSLVRPPAEISLKEVFDALSGKRKTSEEFCSSFSGKSESCVRMEGCSIRPFWQILANYIEELTSEMTLHDLMKTEAQTALRTREIARQKIEKLRKHEQPTA
jgi:Rrf2 family protein